MKRPAVPDPQRARLEWVPEACRRVNAGSRRHLQANHQGSIVAGVSGQPYWAATSQDVPRLSWRRFGHGDSANPGLRARSLLMQSCDRAARAVRGEPIAHELDPVDVAQTAIGHGFKADVVRPGIERDRDRL